MAYEIVKFTDDAGASIQITPQDVRQTFCPTATNQEVQLFLALCATQRLNPWTKEAYLVKYGNGPASIITSRAAIQKRADSNPEYEGVEVGVVVLTAQGTIDHRPGEAYYKALNEQLLGGWAKAYRKGRKPYYSEVPLSEYNTGKSNWAKMPGTMITKVAEMHALRGAFPQDFQGMYSDEEMAQATEVQAEVELPQQLPQQQPEKPRPTVDEKRRMGEVADIAASVGIDRDEARRYIWGLYQANGMASVETWAAQIAPRQAPAPGSAQWAAQTIEAADPNARAVAAGGAVLIADRPEEPYEEAVEPDLYDADASF